MGVSAYADHGALHVVAQFFFSGMRVAKEDKCQQAVVLLRRWSLVCKSQRGNGPLCGKGCQLKSP
jgi:hypothetical protein